MAQFKQRFHGRYHSPGQLITPSELIEMQQLQYKTYCNIEADRYGLNPDGSFTPHVISGLKPSVVAGQHQIKIGRGHGWITNSLSDTDERIPVILEDDLYVDLPAPDGTHPYWCHVMLECLGAGKNATSGNATVATKGIDGIIRNISSPMYFQMTTATAVLSHGTPPAASPECDVIGAPSVLPIATVYIDTSDSGAIPANQLYDVRWFAPGRGSIGYARYDGETAFTRLLGWRTAQEFEAPLEGMSGLPYGKVSVPSHKVFNLVPEVKPVISVMGNDASPTASRLMSALIKRTASSVEHPFDQWVYSVIPFKFDGSGMDMDTECPRWISIDFNPVV